MDLGIAGRQALVAASTAGLGRACARELASAGVRVVVNGRDEERTAQAAAELRDETGGDVVGVAADVGTRHGRDVLIAAVPDADILVTNNAGPPLRSFREVDEAALLAGVEANMVAPIDLVRRLVDGMVERRFGRIVNITSGSVKMPRPGLDVSSAARLGLTGFLAGVAREVASANVTINFLLPGSFDTDRLRHSQIRLAERVGRSLDEERRQALDAIPARRFGQPAEFGAACAYLCSEQAGFLTGQSIVLDGGAYPGVL